VYLCVILQTNLKALNLYTIFFLIAKYAKPANHRQGSMQNPQRKIVLQFVELQKKSRVESPGNLKIFILKKKIH
jgi:hypothetical protein